MQFNSTAAWEASDLYRKLRPEIERVLETVAHERFLLEAAPARPFVRAIGWNIERGIELEAIAETFLRHPILKDSDVLFLTELDLGMARTRNRNVARELAKRLQMDYVFAPSYINLEKGSGLEATVDGENREALHGDALLSRFPLREVRSIPLPNGKDKMRGKEKRLGCQRAVAAIVEHPTQEFRAVSVHLDAHSTQKHRMRQMRLILDELDVWRPELPAVIGGDWNTSTYNSRNALFSILGYARRVLMGVRHVLQNHYPHPDRWFERHLFRELERRGFEYRTLNELGGCTLHYEVNDLAANGRMADWIPGWCFWFINWALKRNDGRCSMKLDWFAGKGVRAGGEVAPSVLCGLHPPRRPLSDHDPIALDFVFD